MTTQTQAKYEGKSLNKRNFFLKCVENYAQQKCLFRDTKWLLSNMPYRGRDDRAIWACAITRTTWPLHCQLAPWKSNEVLFVFLWSGDVKPSEIYRRMKIQYGNSCLSQGRVYEWVERFQNWRQTLVSQFADDNAVMEAVLVKRHAKNLFPRRHPQACGQMDQVCYEAGGLFRKIRHKKIYISTLVKI